MKKNIILVIALTAFIGISCKSKQKLVEIEGANKPAATTVVMEETTAGNQEVTRNETFKIVFGDEAAAAKAYHVVVGSFQNYDNAKRLQSTLKEEGYNSLIARNEREMYRVIIASSDTYNDARSVITGIKSRFSDAWVLIQSK